MLKEPRKKPREPDFSQIARRVVDQATGYKKPAKAAKKRKPTDYESFTLGQHLSPTTFLQVDWPVRFDDGTEPFRHESTALPEDLDYGAVHGLSSEIRERLSATRPDTLGQAARIAGVTPSAVALLLVHLRRRLAS